MHGSSFVKDDGQRLSETEELAKTRSLCLIVGNGGTKASTNF
jgi:hypothetical protein